MNIVKNVNIPNSLDAERAVIGALLHNNLLFEYVSDFLQPKHFYDPLHSKIFEAIVIFVNKGQLANHITLWPIFQNNPLVVERGGQEYLELLSSYILSLNNTGDYGKQIFDRYLRRQLINIGESMIQQAYTIDVNHNAVEEIENSEQKLFTLANEGIKSNCANILYHSIQNSLKIAQQAYLSDKNVVGVESGLLDLDKVLGGFHKSDLIIVAARPSMGKTAICTNIAFNAAYAHFKNPQQGAKVAFFSLEMSDTQLATRILSQEAQISSDAIRRGAINEATFHQLQQVGNKLSMVPLYIDDTPALTIAALRTRARRLKRQENIGLIIIDYLQLLSAGGNNVGDNRVQELSYITRSLKALAKELDLPIIALSQLSRAVEQREDKRPQLADLRESGSIEQDADVVMFIYREAYYEGRKKPSEGSAKMLEWQEKMSKIHNVAEIMIAKQRHGPIRNVMLYFNEKFTKFDNIDINAFYDTKKIGSHAV